MAPAVLTCWAWYGLLSSLYPSSEENISFRFFFTWQVVGSWRRSGEFKLKNVVCDFEIVQWNQVWERNTLNEPSKKTDLNQQGFVVHLRIPFFYPFLFLQKKLLLTSIGRIDVVTIEASRTLDAPSPRPLVKWVISVMGPNMSQLIGHDPQSTMGTHDAESCETLTIINRYVLRAEQNLKTNASFWGSPLEYNITWIIRIESWCKEGSDSEMESVLCAAKLSTSSTKWTSQTMVF